MVWKTKARTNFWIIKNKIELKTRRVLSIDEKSEYARNRIQFIIRFILTNDKLFF